jgi:hypothetical protein
MTTASRNGYCFRSDCKHQRNNRCQRRWIKDPSDNGDACSGYIRSVSRCRKEHYEFLHGGSE